MAQFLYITVLIVFCLFVLFMVAVAAPAIVAWAVGLFVAYLIMCFLVGLAGRF